MQHILYTARPFVSNLFELNETIYSECNTYYILHVLLLMFSEVT